MNKCRKFMTMMTLVLSLTLISQGSFVAQGHNLVAEDACVNFCCIVRHLEESAPKSLISEDGVLRIEYPQILYSTRVAIADLPEEILEIMAENSNMICQDNAYVNVITIIEGYTVIQEFWSMDGQVLRTGSCRPGSHSAVRITGESTHYNHMFWSTMGSPAGFCLRTITTHWVCNACFAVGTERRTEQFFCSSC